MAARVLHSARSGSSAAWRVASLVNAGWGLIAASTVALVAMSGCAPGQQAVTATVAPAPVFAPGQPRENLMWTAPTALIEATIENAAQRSGTPRSEIKVVAAESVTWPDGSLGCPVPGMMYTQALVPGYRIVLQAGGQQLAYHAGAQGSARFCPADRAVAPIPSDRI